STPGATGRTSKVGSDSADSNNARPEPKPIAKPKRSATAASVRFTRAASGVPPVMHEINSGARKLRPRNGVDKSTSSRSISGKALGTNTYASKPLPAPLPATSRSTLICRCSALRDRVAARSDGCDNVPDDFFERLPRAGSGSAARDRGGRAAADPSGERRIAGRGGEIEQRAR